MRIELSDNGILEKLTEFYSQNFEILYNVEADGLIVPVMAAMQNRRQKQILGMPIKGFGPEARENVFFLKEKNFDMEAVSRIRALMEFADREYVHPGPDHAFTFISVVAIAENVESAALSAIKKYKLRRDFHGHGWFVARAVVIGVNGESVCNRDGSDLKKMLKKVLAES